MATASGHVEIMEVSRRRRFRDRSTASSRDAPQLATATRRSTAPISTRPTTPPRRDRLDAATAGDAHSKAPTTGEPANGAAWGAGATVAMLAVLDAFLRAGLRAGATATLALDGRVTLVPKAEQPQEQKQMARTQRRDAVDDTEQREQEPGRSGRRQRSRRRRGRRGRLDGPQRDDETAGAGDAISALDAAADARLSLDAAACAAAARAARAAEADAASACECEYLTHLTEYHASTAAATAIAAANATATAAAAAAANFADESMDGRGAVPRVKRHLDDMHCCLLARRLRVCHCPRA